MRPIQPCWGSLNCPNEAKPGSLFCDDHDEHDSGQAENVVGVLVPGGLILFRIRVAPADKEAPEPPWEWPSGDPEAPPSGPRSISQDDPDHRGDPVFGGDPVHNADNPLGEHPEGDD